MTEEEGDWRKIRDGNDKAGGRKEKLRAVRVSVNAKLISSLS